MMGNHKWTSGEEKLLVDSILAGCSRADICDKLGLSESVVYNHYRAMRATDKTLPMFPRAEKTVVVSEDQAEPHETKEKKVELNPLEKEMADIIAENKETIEALRRDLSVEKEARAEEGKAYREEIERLKAACRAKDEELDKLRERATELAGILARKREQDETEARERDDAARLKYMVRERNEVVYQLVKTIFVGTKEGSRE